MLHPTHPSLPGYTRINSVSTDTVDSRDPSSIRTRSSTKVTKNTGVYTHCPENSTYPTIAEMEPPVRAVPEPLDEDELKWFETRDDAQRFLDAQPPVPPTQPNAYSSGGGVHPHPPEAISIQATRRKGGFEEHDQFGVGTPAQFKALVDANLCEPIGLREMLWGRDCVYFVARHSLHVPMSVLLEDDGVNDDFDTARQDIVDTAKTYLDGLVTFMKDVYGVDVDRNWVYVSWSLDRGRPNANAGAAIYFQLPNIFPSATDRVRFGAHLEASCYDFVPSIYASDNPLPAMYSCDVGTEARQPLTVPGAAMWPDETGAQHDVSLLKRPGRTLMDSNRRELPAPRTSLSSGAEERVQREVRQMVAARGRGAINQNGIERYWYERPDGTPATRPVHFPGRADTLFMSEDMGLGKTHQILEHIREERRANPTLKVIFMVHRRSLSRNLKQRMRRDGADFYDDPNVDITKSTFLVIVIDSLHKLELLDWDLVIADEVNAVLKSITGSGCQRNRPRTWHNFYHIMRKAHKLVNMSADARPSNVGVTFNRIAPDRVAHFQGHEYRKFELYDFTLHHVETRDVAAGVIASKLGDGLRLVVPCTERKDAQALADTIHAAHPSKLVWVVTGQGSWEYRDGAKSPISRNALLTRLIDSDDEHPDLLVFTATIDCGLSIDKRDHYHECLPFVNCHTLDAEDIM